MILADGFYEWQKSPGGGRGKKQPYYIHRPDNRPFAFAGLWEIWSPKRSAEGFAPESDQGGAPSSISSCTIVTTDANERLREIHDRMPVVLSAADYSLWLDPATEDPATLANLLVPCDEDELIAEPVSTHVNQVANDDPQCISVQRSLFN
jgi:putative SOS response-associated peptidase YedK